MFLLIPFLFILLGLALRMAVNLAYGVRGADPQDATPAVVSIVSWCFIGLGLTASLLAPLALSVFGLGIGMVFWIIAGFAIVDSVRASRESSRRMNAKLLSIAEQEGRLEQSLDLLLQLRYGPIVGKATRLLSHELKAGQPLYEATVRNRRALPREAAAFIAIGSLASAEPAALDELTEPDPPEIAVAWRGWLDYSAYALGMLVLMVALLSFLAIKIVPEFNMIFTEFDLELPPMTNALMFGIGGDYIFGAIGAGLLLLMLTLLAIGFFYLIDIELLAGWFDRLRGRTRSANALRLIALAIERQVELRRAIYALSKTYPSKIAQRQLTRSYQAIEKGTPWPEALQTNHLLHADERALVDTAQQVGNVPWALRQLAHRRKLSASLRMNLIGKFACPLLVLGLAAIVAYVVIALFVPLVKLVEGLC